VAEHPGLAAGFAHQSDQDLDQRGLARAVGAKQSEERPARDGEFDAVERLDVPVRLPQAAELQRSIHY
jgi:hypothetical protein